MTMNKTSCQLSGVSVYSSSVSHKICTALLCVLLRHGNSLKWVAHILQCSFIGTGAIVKIVGKMTGIKPQFVGSKMSIRTWMPKLRWIAPYFLQLRRYLGSPDGSSCTGVSPKRFTLPLCCDLVTQQSIKDWHKLGLCSNLVFWVIQTIDGANIDLTYGFELNID